MAKAKIRYQVTPRISYGGMAISGWERGRTSGQKAIEGAFRLARSQMLRAQSLKLALLERGIRLLHQKVDGGVKIDLAGMPEDFQSHIPGLNVMIDRLRQGFDRRLNLWSYPLDICRPETSPQLSYYWLRRDSDYPWRAEINLGYEVDNNLFCHWMGTHRTIQSFELDIVLSARSPKKALQSLLDALRSKVPHTDLFHYFHILREIGVTDIDPARITLIPCVLRDPVILEHDQGVRLTFVPVFIRQGYYNQSWLGWKQVRALEEVSQELHKKRLNAA